MYSIAQTFLVEPERVGGAAEVDLSRIDLFFSAKPKSTNNRSGINNPGVEVCVVPTVDGAPDLSQATSGNRSRMEYSMIRESRNAALETRFRFPALIPIRTNALYAILVKYDGNEDFFLWFSQAGDWLVGTTTESPGQSGRTPGDYYEYRQVAAAANAVSTANSGLITGATASASTPQAASPWRPLPGRDLKYRVYCARYAVNGNRDISNSSVSGVGTVITTS